MIIKALHYSGAPKMFLWVARALADRGFDVTIFTYLHNDVETVPSNVKWIKKDLEKKNFISRLRIAHRIILKERPDCVISFLLDANILNILSCIGTKSRAIVCERNDPFKPRYYVMKAAKPFFRFADGAVYQLPKVAEFYKNIKAPTAIIPNPVLCSSNDQIRPFCERDNVVVSIGRLDIFQKRQDVLIKAFSIFSQKYPNYKLFIYGDGPDEACLKEIISVLGLEGKVVLGGVVSNPQKLIKNAKLFVLSSDFEGIPNALIEAMVIGLPCVSTDCSPGGATFLIKNNVNGIVVPPHDECALAEQMMDLVENPEKANRLGDNAKKIADDLSENKIAQKWCDYINQFR